MIKSPKLFLAAIVAFLITGQLCSAATSKYRLSVRDNGATSMVICWSDDDADVAYGTTDHGTNFNAYSNTVTAAQTVDKSEKGLNHHFARLTGLTPNTVYYFVIKAGTHLSPRMSFKTLPSGSGYTMITGGDSRSNRDVRQDGNRLVAKLRPQAVVFCGDFTNANTDAEWNEWLDDWQLTRSSDGRMQPIIPVLGNHEGYTPSNIIDIFDAKAAYFTVELGDTVVASLVSNGDMVAQGNWLQSELTNYMDKRWRVVSYHKPMRVHSTAKGDDNNIYNAWAQIFYDYKVQLSVDGDTHLSKTTWPIRPDAGGEDGFVRDDENGTVFCGEGSWGAPLRPYNNAKSWTRKGGSFAQFKWINVQSDKMTLRTVKFENVNSVGTVSDQNPYAMPSGLVLHGGDIDVTGGQVPPNSSDFISQSVPTAMIPGSTQQVSITMKNNGEDTWKASDGHRLGTQNPQGNNTWYGASRVHLTHDVLPGQEYTFTFQITAPSTVGNYDFQWRMVDDIAPNQEWFGDLTQNISISVANAGQGATQTVNVTVNDDIEEQLSTGDLANSSDLEFIHADEGTPDRGDQIIGLQFSGINVPQGANVTNAYLQFTGDAQNAGSDGPTTLNISGHDVDNSGTFATGVTSDVSGRNTTSESVNWNPPAWSEGVSGSAEQSPDISTVIGAIVGRPGWNSGNALSLIISGTQGLGAPARRAESTTGDGGAAVLHIEYSVGTANYVPAWSAPVISKTVVQGSGAYAASLTGDIADDDALSFSEVSFDGGPGSDWLTVSSGGNLSGTVPSNTGTFRWTVSADDSTHPAVNAVLEIIVVSAGNNAPIVTSSPTTGIIEDNDYEYTIEMFDADGDNVSILAGSSTMPSWLSLNAGAHYLSGTPTPSDVGSHSVNIVVTDGNVNVNHSFNIQVFTTPLPANIVVNGSFEDGGASATPWELGDNSEVTTEESYSGSRSLKVMTGTSNNWNRNFQIQPNTDYTLSVWIDATGLTSGRVHFDTADRFDSGINGQPCQFNIDPGDADGWTEFTGMFNSGTFSDMSIRTYKTNNVGTVYVDNIVIAPVGATANVAPVFTWTEVTSVDYDQSYCYDVTVADPDGDPVFFSSNTVPNWLNFDPNTGQLCGYPGLGNVGNHAVSISISDGTEITTLNFTITVHPPANVAPVWNSGTIVKANAEADSAYSGSLSGDVSDADGDSLTFNKTGGSSWLTVASNGALSGTPGAGDVGADSFTVTVSDGVNPAVPVTVNITVDAAPDPYVVWKDDVFTNPNAPLTGRTQDFDGDGKTNEYEYLLAMDPEDSGNARDPQAETVNLGNEYPGMSYHREIGTTHTIEFCTSADLVNWSTWASAGTDVFEAGTSANGDGTEKVTVRYKDSYNTVPRIFMKIRVTEN